MGDLRMRGGREAKGKFHPPWPLEGDAPGVKLNWGQLRGALRKPACDGFARIGVGTPGSQIDSGREVIPAKRFDAQVNRGLHAAGLVGEHDSSLVVGGDDVDADVSRNDAFAEFFGSGREIDGFPAGWFRRRSHTKGVPCQGAGALINVCKASGVI